MQLGREQGARVVMKEGKDEMWSVRKTKGKNEATYKTIILLFVNTLAP